jgi:lysophospholipase L1-like esterase
MPAVSLSVHTILAFGDSITEGEVPDPGEFPPVRTSSIRPFVVYPAQSYPADLVSLLAARYPTQGASRIDAFTLFTADNTTDCSTDTPRQTSSGIVVINAGCLGEAAEDPKALARLNDKLNFYHPDLVLILEGTNDIGSIASDQAGVTGVQGLIQAAKACVACGTGGAGAKVMVSTLLPQVPADFTHGGDATDVQIFNLLLGPMVESTGSTLVDMYSDINTNVNAWISPYDGLHPTAAGYQEMARYWFTFIQAAFEVTASSTGRATARPIAAPAKIQTPAAARTR